MTTTHASLNELYKLEQPNWESVFRAGLQSFIESGSSPHQNGEPDILNLGQHILTKGSPVQQTLILDLGRNRRFVNVLANLGYTEKWFELEWQLIQALNFTPGKLVQLRQQQFAKKSLFRYQANYQ